MFSPITSKPDFKQLEEETLKFWKARDIFHQSTDRRQGGRPYVFFEGPPTANGKPGVHHVLARAFKDMFPRYKAMTGHYVLRRGGWDTHGLPVELEVEKKLGLTDKKQIEAYGIAPFNAKCRQSAFDYIQEWEKLTDRIAFWVDLKEAYVTFTNDYVESVWWILRQLWDKDLLYQGFKVVPYCPRCGTPLSDHEVALGYQEDTPDPSVFVRFPLADEADTAFLVWTTTPWTLPANVALAVHPDVQYVKIERTIGEDGDKECLILARDRVDQVLGDEKVEVVETYKGSELRGKRYKPLFTFVPPDREAHYVVMGDFVTVADGTGVVHQAPAFGAEDMQMANDYNLPVLMTIDAEGRFIDAVTPWRGKFFKDADPLIARDLDDRGLLFRSGTYYHTYPFCWRCHTPLLYYARSTWYIETTHFKDRLVGLNQSIHWHPGHIREGRFGNWLANNLDWALGRERYWGTPLPVWTCGQCGHQHCVGSVAELSTLTGQDQSQLDLHRPYVDEIKFLCPACHEGQMYRVPELIDVWFDSGAMPVAQWHYPFENRDKFAEQFPADFICEAVDQTRGWFYSLHAISTMLFDSVAYRNVICLGLILDAEGRKMSKSLGNIVNPWEVLNAHGADAFRWYLYTATPPGQERRFSVNLVGEVVRAFMLTLWNTYAFFITYANLDQWRPDKEEGSRQKEEGDGEEAGRSRQAEAKAGEGVSVLDRWVLSELHTLVREVSAAYESYDVTGATRPIEKFVDNLSNWYLRRSRRRFWKSGASADKQAAYATLYECLTTLARLLAPAMPFLADALYRNLVLSVDATQPESVHLADWPAVDPARIDEALNAEMRLAMKLVSLGHGARNKASRKVRQPLAEAAFAVGNADERRVISAYADLIADELNVKAVRALGAAGEAVTYALNPLPKQLGQKHGGRYPKLRAELLKLDAEPAARQLLAGQPVSVEVDGQSVEVLPEEVEVRLNARAGFAVLGEGSYLAALKTALTPDLVREGLAREFVRRVQDLRKTAGFDIADRIHTYYTATPALAKAIAAFADYIQSETLSVELTAGPAPEGAATAEDAFDGEKVKVGVIKK